MIDTGTNTPLLLGIVGSTAYGLARDGSDVDRIGVYAAPTLDFARLHPFAGRDFSASQHVPSDVTVHEAGKFARLALTVNPTVTEVLWLPDDLYEVRSELGDELIGIRSAFLSAGRVRAAYMEYARDQFRRLEARGDGSFSADTRKRTAKHARHLYRLCYQGLHLYRTGELLVRLEDPDLFVQFGEQVAAGDIELARMTMAAFTQMFDAARPPLPERPDERAVEAWLLRVRAQFFPLPAVRWAVGIPVAADDVR